MAVAKRTGPDFLFIANANSQKFDDLKHSSIANLYFHSSKQDWISVTGEAVVASNEDARIKELYSKTVSAWFGDLGDGVHTGGPEDPRMKLIEVQAKCKSTGSEWRREKALTFGQISITTNMMSVVLDLERKCWEPLPLEALHRLVP